MASIGAIADGENGASVRGKLNAAIAEANKVEGKQDASELGDAAFADILGIVSQSGGVPTGAIIERGSNDDGEYVKFADGTMICTMSDTRSIDTNQNATLDGGRFLLPSNRDFPSTFIATPSTSAQTTDSGTWVNPRLLSTTSYRYAVFSNVPSDRGVNTISLTAIGQWY